MAEDRSAAPGSTGPNNEGQAILTLVCVKCGKEYYFDDGEAPDKIVCEKCGNEVFRSYTSSDGSEASEDFEETTGRDLDADDAEGDTLPGDVLDLNRD